MILAKLNRAEGSRKAYEESTRKLPAVFPPDYDCLYSVIISYASHVLHLEAREVLRNQGMTVPDVETSP